MFLKFGSWKSKNDIFEAVKSGKKTIETRPAIDKYLSINVGDVIDLLSLDTGEKIEKKIVFVRKYETTREMGENEEVFRIVPGVKTVEELESVFEEFKKKWGKEYAERVKKNGILAIGME